MHECNSARASTFWAITELQSAFTGCQKEGIASQTKHWMAADPSTPTYLELRRDASPCLANSARFALHPREQWKCSRPRGANDSTVFLQLPSIRKHSNVQSLFRKHSPAKQYTTTYAISTRKPLRTTVYL